VRTRRRTDHNVQRFARSSSIGFSHPIFSAPISFHIVGLAFAYDPDGYSVEIIKRGGIDFGDAKKD